MIEKRYLPKDCYSHRSLDTISGVVIHYISAVNVAPDKKYDMETIRKLFIELCMPNMRGELLNPDPAPDKKIYASAHFLVGRDGTTWQLVPEDDQAWHAGKSMYKNRSNLNGWTIGIEIVGEYDVPFEAVQYKKAAELIEVIQSMPNADFVVERNLTTSGVIGHEHVATPLGRKKDPGPSFEWELLWDHLGV